MRHIILGPFSTSLVGSLMNRLLEVSKLLVGQVSMPNRDALGDLNVVNGPLYMGAICMQLKRKPVVDSKPRNIVASSAGHLPFVLGVSWRVFLLFCAVEPLFNSSVLFTCRFN